MLTAVTLIPLGFSMRETVIASDLPNLVHSRNVASLEAFLFHLCVHL